MINFGNWTFKEFIGKTRGGLTQCVAICPSCHKDIIKTYCQRDFEYSSCKECSNKNKTTIVKDITIHTLKVLETGFRKKNTSGKKIHSMCKCTKCNQTMFIRNADIRSKGCPVCRVINRLPTYNDFEERN